MNAYHLPGPVVPSSLYVLTLCALVDASSRGMHSEAELKRQSLEQRKVCSRAKPEQVAHAPNCKLPNGLRGEDFIGKTWGAGHRVCGCLLIG